MTETHTDFLLYSGSTWQFDASLHDAACNPLDLTGALVVWTLYDGKGAKKITLNRDSGISMVNEVGGVCRITVPDDKTKPIAPGVYRDEIVVTMPSGFVSTQAVGTIIVNKPGGVPIAPGDVSDPCAVLARLQNARLALLTGQQQVRVKIENFEVQYGPTSADALDGAIRQYESLCRKQTGKPPRRFAIGSTVRPRSY